MALLYGNRLVPCDCVWYHHPLCLYGLVCIEQSMKTFEIIDNFTFKWYNGMRLSIFVTVNLSLSILIFRYFYIWILNTWSPEPLFKTSLSTTISFKSLSYSTIVLYSRDGHWWWAWSMKKSTQAHLQESFKATW